MIDHAYNSANVNELDVLIERDKAATASFPSLAVAGYDNRGIIPVRVSLDPQIIHTFTEEYRPDLPDRVTVIHGKGYPIDGTSWQAELYWEEAPTEREGKVPPFPTASVITARLAKFASGWVPEIGNPKWTQLSSP